MEAWKKGRATQGGITNSAVPCQACGHSPFPCAGGLRCLRDPVLYQEYGYPRHRPHPPPLGGFLLKTQDGI